MLERKIEEKVLNCGVPAYSTIQELDKLKKILGGYKKKNLHNPSLIILQYTFNNDFLGDYLFPQYKVQNNILTNNRYLDNIFSGKIRYKEENKYWDKLKYDLNQKFYLFRILHRSHSFLRKIFYGLLNRFLAKKYVETLFSRTIIICVYLDS